MLPVPARDYLINNLDNTPATLSALLSGLQGNSPAWDVRPDPERFSLREIMAHLADWDEVWRERFERSVNEDVPLLLRPDLNQRAQEQGYAQVEPHECLARLQKERTALTGWLRSLPEGAWTCLARLERMGDIPVEGLAALVLAHDSYHLRQVAEWLAAVPRR
jgi:uncharacterized damage-inducible protein DinB